MTATPNLLLILMDDLGAIDLSCCGSSFYETPNLDRLAAAGVRFTSAYAACPVCSPTRASIMTGKYPARLGLTDWIHHARPGDAPHGHARGRLFDAPYIDHLPLSECSLATALRDGGYQTWHVGKWHLGKEPFYPERHGFDVNVGGCHAGSPGAGGYFSPWSIPALRDAPVPAGTYLPDYLADEAIELIRNRDPDRPFFLNYWDYLVHTPIQAPAHLVRKYQDKARALGLDEMVAFADGDFYPCEHKKTERIRRRLLQSDPVYAAMVENMDTNIGRLLGCLRGEGLEENTLVVFTSDNGGLATAEGSPTCNHPLAEGKGWMYEGGVREPLLACWPGRIAEGATCDVPVISTDLYPTLLEAAGLPLRPEQHADGVSLLPLLTGEGTLEREDLFWHYPHYGNQGGTPGSCIRSGRWKLLEFFEDDHVELYDLEADPGETRNLAAAEPRVSARLRERLHLWQQEVQARRPEPNPEFVPWRDADRGARKG